MKSLVGFYGSGMRISKINLHFLRIPLANPFVMSEFTVHHMHYVVVEAVSSCGLRGFGEATPSWDVNGETPSSVAGLIELLTTKSMSGYSLFEQEFRSVKDVFSLMREVVNPVKGFVLVQGNTAGKAALEQALLHLVLQSEEKPFATELVGREIPCSSTISIKGVEETCSAVQQACRAGAFVIRLKVGSSGVGVERDVQAVLRAREIIDEMSPCTKLAGDANQGFRTVRNTVRFLNKIEHCLDWLEQPTVACDLEAFSEISKQTSVPLMADESVKDYYTAERLLQQGGVSLINVKLMKTGGLAGALDLVDLAESYGVNWQIGSMIETKLGVLPAVALYFLRPTALCTDLSVVNLLRKDYSSAVGASEVGISLNECALSGVVDRKAMESFAYRTTEFSAEGLIC